MISTAPCASLFPEICLHYNVLVGQGLGYCAHNVKKMGLHIKVDFNKPFCNDSIAPPDKPESNLTVFLKTYTMAQ